MKGNVITVIKIQLNVRRHRHYHNQTTKTKKKPHIARLFICYIVVVFIVLYARRFVSRSPTQGERKKRFVLRGIVIIWKDNNSKPHQTAGKQQQAKKNTRKTVCSFPSETWLTG